MCSSVLKVSMSLAQVYLDIKQINISMAEKVFTIYIFINYIPTIQALTVHTQNILTCNMSSKYEKQINMKKKYLSKMLIENYNLFLTISLHW